MIISASRRTDVPAFYAEWFMNRVRAGSCEVANPFNPSMVRTVSLRPEDVEAVVFWTKNPRSLEPHLDELDAAGLRHAFLFTVNDYPPELEPKMPPLAERLAAFRRLAARVGPPAMTWRYDPIILGEGLEPDWHLRRFDAIAARLEGCVSRVVVSFLDFYRKTERRMAELEQGARRFHRDPADHPIAADLLARLAGIARSHGMALQTCCEKARFAEAGASPGGCLDAAWLAAAVGRPVAAPRDRGQRPDCLCIRSVDIGAPDTCVHHCRYCYATRSAECADRAFARHDPNAASLRLAGRGRVV